MHVQSSRYCIYLAKCEETTAYLHAFDEWNCEWQFDEGCEQSCIGDGESGDSCSRRGMLRTGVGNRVLTSEAHASCAAGPSGESELEVARLTRRAVAARARRKLSADRALKVHQRGLREGARVHVYERHLWRVRMRMRFSAGAGAGAGARELSTGATGEVASMPMERRRKERHPE